jgi:cytochrome P450
MDLSLTLKLALSGLILSLFLWCLYCWLWHPLRKIPGPFWWSVSRIPYVAGVYRGKMDKVQREQHRKYGPLVRISPNEVSVADPEAIRDIYRIKRPFKKTEFYPIWNSGRLTKYSDHFSQTDERMHSERRRIVNSVYSMSTVLTLEPYIDKCSAMFMERLSSYADAQRELDLGVWLQWYPNRCQLPL